MHDREFMSANQVFSAVLKLLKESGLDKSTHKSPILQGDMEKMYTSKVLGNDSPQSLQRKVFVELLLHFGRRGKEGLRELRKDSFQIEKDDRGRSYVTIGYNEFDKNHTAEGRQDKENKMQIMYSQVGDPLCPVVSFQKYLDKLNPLQVAFFQRPKSLACSEDDHWYENKPLGVNTIANMMKTISKEAKLSQVYTNHCLRATTATVLANAGVSSRDICAVTGHHNEGSLKSYITATSFQKRNEMCGMLHTYGKQYDRPLQSESGLDKPETSIHEPGPSENTMVVGLEVSNGNNSGTSIDGIDRFRPRPVGQNTNQLTRSAETHTASSLFAGAHFSAPANITININGMTSS